MSQTPVPITGGSGTSSIAAELVNGTSWQQIEVYGGGGASVLAVNPDGSIKVSIVGIPNVAVAGGSVGLLAGSAFIGNVGIVSGSIATIASGNQSVSGTVGASIIGTVPVVQSGIFITSITGTPSISGQVGASVIGTVPVVQSGSWSTSVVGGPVTLYAPTTSFVSGVTSVITGTSSVQVLAPAAGGQRNYITQVLVTNGAAVSTTVNLFDGGNVIYSGFAAASGGGFALTFPVPLRQASLAGNLSALSTVAASVIVAASGYTAI